MYSPDFFVLEKEQEKEKICFYLCGMSTSRNIYDKYYPIRKGEGIKGRSPKLIESRDRALCMRYFYYTEHKQLRYDVVINRLSNEFYLTEFTIVKRLNKLTDVLDELYADKPEVKDLRKAYPHYCWHEKTTN